MLPVTFDTNVFIDYDLTELPKSGFFLSAVVVQELTAGARDDAIRRLAEFRRRYEADGKLLVPTGEDWWHAGKILNAMHRGLKSHRAGRSSAIPKEEQQRILRDVLIARTAKRANVAVVTGTSRTSSGSSATATCASFAPRTTFLPDHPC